MITLYNVIRRKISQYNFLDPIQNYRLYDTGTKELICIINNMLSNYNKHVCIVQLTIDSKDHMN